MKLDTIGVVLLNFACFTCTLAYNLQRTDNGDFDNKSDNLSSNTQHVLTVRRYPDTFRIITKRNYSQEGNLQSVLVYSLDTGDTSRDSSTTRLFGVSPTTAEVEPLSSWSIVWYVGSFGSLIAFFLIVSCSEWCCRRNVRHRCSVNNSGNDQETPVPETPPPSYDHFAPPPYESLVSRQHSGEKTEYDIYVVPVHALGTIMESHRTENPEYLDAPPPYVNANSILNPATLYSPYPTVHSHVSRTATETTITTESSNSSTAAGASESSRSVTNPSSHIEELRVNT